MDPLTALIALLDPLNALRFASVVGWLYLGWRITGRAARAFTHAARRDDPWFAIVVGFGLIYLIFATRYYFLDLPEQRGAPRDWLIIAYALTVILQVVVLRFAAWGRHNAP